MLSFLGAILSARLLFWQERSILTKEPGLLVCGNAALVFIAIFITANYAASTTVWFYLADSPFFLTTLITLSLAAIFFKHTSPAAYRYISEDSRGRSLVWAILASLTLSAPTLMLTFRMPLVGWDVLDFWAIKASQIIVSGCSAAGTCVDVSKKHPDMFIHFLATLMQESTSIYRVALAWLSPYLGVYIVAVGAGVVMGGKKLAVYLVPFFLLSSPIYVNSIAIPGYVDIWVALYTTAGSMGLALYLQDTRRKISLYTSILFLLLAGVMKAGSFIFSVVPLLVLLLVKLMGKRPRARSAVLGCIILTGVTLIPHVGNFDFSVFDHRIAYFPTSSKLVFNTFSIELTPNEPAAVLDAIWNAVVLNTSYSVSILFIFIALLTLRVAADRTQELQLYALWLTAIYCILLALLLIYVPHFYNAATPTSDTGLTRHAQTPVLVTSMTLFVLSARGVSTR